VVAGGVCARARTAPPPGHVGACAPPPRLLPPLPLLLLNFSRCGDEWRWHTACPHSQQTSLAAYTHPLTTTQAACSSKSRS
jgi:hypothetical protein